MAPTWIIAARARPLAFAAAALCASPAARAQCRVLSGPEGEVATLLLRAGDGPGALVPRPTLRATLDGALTRAVSALPSIDAPGWRTGVDDEPALHAGRALGGRAPRVVHAALRLDASTAGVRWLFVGSDDALAVHVDGREVLHRALARRAREDDDAVRLDLAAGPHTVVLTSVARQGPDLYVRVTGADHRPDPSLTITLPGVAAEACNALTARALHASFARAVVADGTRVTATFAFPGGVAASAGAMPTRFALSSPGSSDVTVPVAATASAPSVEASITVAAEGLREVHAVLGPLARDARVAVDARVRAALLHARALLSPLDGSFDAAPSPMPWAAEPRGGSVSDDAVASVEALALRLGRLVSAGDPDALHLREEAATLEGLVGDLAAGRDPYAGRTGPMHRAWRSPLDGTLQEFSLYVPPRARPGRTWPLIVGLHGLHGGSHRMLPVLLGLYDEHEDRTRAERHLPPLPDTDAFLLAPYGYGDSGYRQQGEVDVVAAMDAVQRAYGIDPSRVYLTGLSMGGIGAAGVAFHHPDRFAAIAPLCGYHSYFVRTDTRTVRRPWETFLMELRSNANAAENGLHLPMYLVQGTLDRPLANSQVLVDRYQQLGYAQEVEWPPLGHNVWSQTYAGGRIVPHFARFRRDAAPRHVRFRTPELRWNHSDWVTIDALLAPGTTDGARRARTGRWGDIDATVGASGDVAVRTDGVAALTLSVPAQLLAATAAPRVTLDGDALPLPHTGSASFRRRDGHWIASERVTVRAGGPIREVFDTPMLFVVGTGDAAARPLYERTARAWAHRGGVPLRYPVVTDRAYTDAMGAGRTLVLIGTPRDNAVLGRVAARLPVDLGESAVAVGSHRFAASSVGTVFTAEDPDRPGRALLVVSGRSPEAVLRSVSLPDLLPQYVVFDDGVAGARGRVLLGPAASVLAAGFFDDDGHPAGDDRDPVTTTSADAPEE